MPRDSKRIYREMRAAGWGREQMMELARKGQPDKGQIDIEDRLIDEVLAELVTPVTQSD